MAITATIALNPSTVLAAPGVSSTAVATVTISNSAAGGPSVPILGIRPIVYDHGTQQEMGGVSTDSVAPPAPVAFGGNVTATFGVAFYGLQAAGAAGGQSTASQVQLDVTCEVVCGDGTVVIPTVAVLTVNPSPHS